MGNEILGNKKSFVTEECVCVANQDRVKKMVDPDYELFIQRTNNYRF